MAKADRVNPAAAASGRVGELGHEIGKGHLGAPLGARRLRFNFLDVGGKYAHLEVCRTGRYHEKKTLSF